MILTVDGRYNAAYEMYAHAGLAAKAGLSEEQMATLCAGERPEGLDLDAKVAADVASALVRGGVTTEPLYNTAVGVLGQDGLASAVFLTINYFAICSVLNACDVQLPN
ncbi:hypothetical protein ACQB60_07585 [Actinomycetota bacterium Odt1-20B]